jgi:hypothetical protein
MPDLTTEYATACQTVREWETTVPSSSGRGSYTVRFGRLFGRDADIQGALHGWTCTCKGFDIRRTCSHVTRVAASGARCGWDDRWDAEEAAEDAQGQPCCPRCSGPTFVYTFGA